MTIDFANVHPLAALAGGALIGAASVVLALALGRIAGVSGIVGGLLSPTPAAPPAPRGDVAWRLAFVAGLVAAPLAWSRFAPMPALHLSPSLALLAVAGLCVGVGTRYAGGCTSGHGVCGLSRRSPRSLVATLSFMAAGFATVYVLRHHLA